MSRHFGQEEEEENYRLNCDLFDLPDFGDAEAKFIIFIKIITKIIVQTVEITI